MQEWGSQASRPLPSFLCLKWDFFQFFFFLRRATSEACARLRVWGALLSPWFARPIWRGGPCSAPWHRGVEGGFKPRKSTGFWQPTQPWRESRYGTEAGEAVNKIGSTSPLPSPGQGRGCLSQLGGVSGIFLKLPALLGGVCAKCFFLGYREARPPPAAVPPHPSSLDHICKLDLFVFSSLALVQRATFHIRALLHVRLRPSPKCLFLSERFVK